MVHHPALRAGKIALAIFAGLAFLWFAVTYVLAASPFFAAYHVDARFVAYTVLLLTVAAIVAAVIGGLMVATEDTAEPPRTW